MRFGRRKVAFVGAKLGFARRKSCFGEREVGFVRINGEIWGGKGGL